MNSNKETDLLARAAWLYYQESLTQEAVAKRLGVSRQKAQRLLQEARDRGIVHVRILHPSANLLQIEGELAERWGLEDAVVAPSGGENPVDALGRAAAGYLERLVSQRHTLGVASGRTLHLMSRHFAPDPAPLHGERRVVAVMGNLLESSATNPYSIGERLAERWGASFYNLWAPAIVRDRRTAEVFRSEPWIQRVLNIGSEADLTVSSVGSVAEETTLVELRYLGGEEMRRLQAKGAVGSILSQYFNSEGELLEDEVHERVIALPLSEASEKNGLVLVAGGLEKRAAIRAALKGRFARCLVTDEETARWLLEPSPEETL